MLPMERVKVPSMMTLAVGKCSHEHVYGVTSMCSGNVLSCSTDMATTGFLSFPLVISSTACLSGSEFLWTAWAVLVVWAFWLHLLGRCNRRSRGRDICGTDNILFCRLLSFFVKKLLGAWPQHPSTPQQRCQQEFSLWTSIRDCIPWSDRLVLCLPSFSHGRAFWRIQLQVPPSWLCLGY